MKTTNEHNERMAKMSFASVYPHYVTKVEKKNRTKEELHKEKMESISDVELLREFRRRFHDSVLEAGSVNVVLNTIGIKLIRRFLDECNLKVIKKPNPRK